MAVPAQQSRHLTDEQIETFREQLRDAWRDILHRHGLHHLVELDVQPAEVGDEADAAVGERERELELELGERELNRLHEIEDALERIENGTYGICEESGEPIAQERLEAIPEARYTAAVQAWHEGEGPSVEERTTGENAEAPERTAERVDSGPGSDSDLLGGSDPK